MTTADTSTAKNEAKEIERGLREIKERIRDLLKESLGLCPPGSDMPDDAFTLRSTRDLLTQILIFEAVLRVLKQSARAVGTPEEELKSAKKAAKALVANLEVVAVPEALRGTVTEKLKEQAHKRVDPEACACGACTLRAALESVMADKRARENGPQA